MTLADIDSGSNVLAMGVRIKIEAPCNEDWEKMRIGVDSRHCDACQKNVIDFTDKSRREIIEYILLHPNERICGRMNAQQFDFSETEFKHAAENLITRTGNLLHKEMIAASLAMLLFTMDATANHNQIDQLPIQESVVTSIYKPYNLESNSFANDTSKKVITSKDTSIRRDKTIYPDTLIYREHTVYGLNRRAHILGELHTLGKLVINGTYKSARYEYGYDSLMNFIYTDVVKKYPEVDTIKGKLVKVEVTVGRWGRLRKLKIIDPDPNFDLLERKVKRAIKKTSRWEPAKQDGKRVSSRLVLYVRF